MAENLEIQKIDGKSLDIETTEKERLKAVFPQCFTEGKLDIDKLLSLCGEYIDNDFEKYKFEWKGKSECYRIAGKRSTGTLRPCPEESVGFENTNNLYIEGDNLEVLKLLQSAYYRKVKMIYIDPPYNTGNDFVYEDDFKDPMAKYKEITSQTTKSNPETMGRYHTNWLNMMYPRLRLAANLLRDDGVIFISIDDNEIDNLKKICNEVFGEENFAGQITVVGNPRGRDYGGIARMHDYLVVYKKSPLAEINNINDPDKKFPYSDSLGGFEIRELRNRNIAFNSINRPNLYYPFYINTNNIVDNGFYEISLEKKDGWFELYPKESQGYKTVWRWGKEKSANNLNINILAKKMQDGGYQIIEKYREKSYMARSVWSTKDTNTEKGTLLLKELMEAKVFGFPKPMEMLKMIIEMGATTDDIILDFFSGSATTAHAVMQLNAEDGGKRQFIMVQLPEITDENSEAYKAGYKNICEIGKERIRRAGKKYLQSAGVGIKKEETKRALNLTGQPEELLKLGMVSSYNTGNGSEATYKNGFVETLTQNGVPQPLVDVGFKVFKLDTSNLTKWDDTPLNSTDTADLFSRMDGMIESIKKGRSELDVVYEVMLKLGIPVTYKVFENNLNGRKVYSIGDDGLVLVCLDGSNGGITPEDVSAMCELAPAKIIAAEEAFKDDIALSNAFYISKDKGIEIELL